MATSRSVEHCTATALVYSGRQDPTWPVRASVARRLEEIWDALPEFSGPSPEAPPLGYRGARLVCGDREWAVGGGVVTLGRQRRRDPAQLFERTLLDSAPSGTLPPFARPGASSRGRPGAGR
jgi:hypothetical protein